MVSDGGICDVQAIHGNADDPLVRAALPDRRRLTVAGRRIGMIHGNRPRAIEASYTNPGDTYDSPVTTSFYRYLTQVLPDAEVIVFGRSHLPVTMTWERRLLVNPGAVANKRRPTSALLHVGADELWAEIIDLEG